MNPYFQEAFWAEVEKLAEERTQVGLKFDGPDLKLPKYPWKPLVAGAAAAGMGAGAGTMLVRLLQETTKNKYPALKYLGPLSLAVSGALIGATAMQARAEKEQIDAFRTSPASAPRKQA